MTEKIIGTKRVYAHKAYESTEKSLIDHLEELRVFREETNEDSYNLAHKKLCNHMRELIETDNILGLILSKRKDSGEPLVWIPMYTIKATDDNFFTQSYDENECNFYIEVEESI